MSKLYNVIDYNREFGLELRVSEQTKFFFMSKILYEIVENNRVYRSTTNMAEATSWFRNRLESLQQSKSRDEEDRRRREQDEEDRQRRQRERDEEDRRRRDDDTNTMQYNNSTLLYPSFYQPRARDDWSTQSAPAPVQQEETRSSVCSRSTDDDYTPSRTPSYSYSRCDDTMASDTSRDASSSDTSSDSGSSSWD